MLVDDEKIELEALEHYVPWEAMGLRVAGTARNGKEALEQMKMLDPQIVITDVRMPVMDGLEFARRAKQLNANVKIIFLSGHNEFQYIKSALNLEASGYLLKPVDVSELGETMEKMKNRLDSEALLVHSAVSISEGLLFKLLHEPSLQLRQELSAELKLVQPSLHADGLLAASYLIVAPSAENEGTMSNPRTLLPGEGAILGAHDIWVKVPPHAWFIMHHIPIGHAHAAKQLLRTYWERWQHENPDGTASVVGISALGSGSLKLEELYDRYTEAKNAAEERFFARTGAVIFYEELLPATATVPAVDPLIKELGTLVSKGMPGLAEKQIGQFVEQVRQERVQPRQIRSSAVHIISALEQHFSAMIAHTQPELLMIDHWKNVAEQITLEEIRAYLTDYCIRLCSLVAGKETDRNAAVVQKITEFIQEHYGKSLTVEKIAAHVYLSPNYVRSLFKEHTGETILNYITQLRMQKASELLKRPELKIHEIALAVGYENTSYFCSVFHKHMGCTPSEYRNSMSY
nr:response regulator [Paenibacillus roseus]